MATDRQQTRKYVVVHGGARDSYQVALALHHAGLLQSLITDIFNAPDRSSIWTRLLPSRVTSLLQSRVAPIPHSCVRQCWFTGVIAAVLERCGWVPFAIRRIARRISDGSLGKTAGRLAASTQSELLAYSYFGEAAFRSYGRPALLFQVHPHPLTMRRILKEELALHPECAASLEQEWELGLPESDLRSLVRESELAQAYIVASSFTRNSLIEHGVSPQKISVVPYGIDLERFQPATAKNRQGSTLRLLFVGRINQRKGLAYLLQALALLSDVDVHLTICGRVVDDLQLFRPFAERVTIRPSVSAEELTEAYQQADLFVFPSVAEGFGQVLLEALACGLPILSTSSTAAPDLIQDGVQGWIVEPRNVQQFADRIRWASEHREVLRSMSAAARERAEQYTWQRFRDGVVDFVTSQPGARPYTHVAHDTELVRA